MKRARPIVSIGTIAMVIICGEHTELAIKIKSYYKNIYSKPRKIKLSKKFRKKFSHMKTKTLYQKVVKTFIEYGYHRAVDEVNELYSKDKISLPQKGKMVSNLADLQMMTSKEKKFFKKLNKDQL